MKNKIKELNLIYQQKWGKGVDYTIIPRGISQEQLVDCLELMIETNDSLLVSYNKLFLKNNEKKGYIYGDKRIN